MIHSIIRFSIQHKFIVLLLLVLIVGGGLYSLSTINVDSTPDITNNQVQVITVAENLSTADIEQYVTYPIELAMANLPGVEDIRSVSRFGLSVVTIVFRERMGTYEPRQLVHEKIEEVKDEIPEGFGSPEIGPITTGLGEIYQYTLVPRDTTRYTAQELRTIQDWIVKRQLAMIPGVVEVNSFGGSIKQYEVALNPQRLLALRTTIGEVMEALHKNNVNTGGAYIEKNHTANFIRGEGLVKSLDDIRNIVVKQQGGVPVLVGDVADDVRFGAQVRYGAFTQDGREAVGGTIMMLKGANSAKVVAAVKDRIATIQKSLPPGIEIRPFLDRSELIQRTTSTIATNLAEGALIVVLVLVLLLGSVRGGLIAASVIPLSLLFAFILMRVFGVWANLMSLGSIDFGIIVDGAVIIVEGIVAETRRRLAATTAPLTARAMDDISYRSAATMMHSAFFGQLIILIVFAPIVFLSGISGKMFAPMAYTFSFAVLGALILCLTYVPMVSAVVMRPTARPQSLLARIERGVERMGERLMAALVARYHPWLVRAVRHRMAVLAAAALLLAGAGVTFARMGGEFIPSLDEGDIAMQTFLRPGSALTETIEREKEVERLLLDNFPEVKTVCARIGVADIPTDPMGFDYTDSFIILEKDRSRWTSAKTKEELIEKMKHKLSELPGLNFSFSQPVELRFNELLTGVREDVAVKLYGEDLHELNRLGQQMVDIISRIPGTADVALERTDGLPQITVSYDRQRLARYGLDIEKLNTYVSSAFAGGKAGVVFEGEKRFDLVVRLAPSFRGSLDDVRALYVDTPDGQQIPLGEVADVSYQPGPMQISRDRASRRISVGVNVRGTDVESMVASIRQQLDRQLKLPAGYHLAYGGEFENLQEAKARLAVVLPVAMALIFILLYFALKSVRQSLMIYMAVPMAAIGGVLALALRGMPFSISAGVGFIVLFGVAVLNGLVLVNRFNTLKAEGMDNLNRRILTGTRERIRPILLTAAAAMLGFMPMAVSQSAGAEVQRPLATVVIGGLFSATVLTLFVIPILYSLEERLGSRQRRKTVQLRTMAVGLVMLMPLGLRAQEPLSLDSAVARALANYPVVRAARLEIAGQQALQRAARDIGPTEVSTGGEELGRGNDGVWTLVAVRQNLDILAIGARSAYQRQRVAVATTAARVAETELARQVSIDYAMAFVAERRLRVYARLDSLCRDLEEAARLRYETQASSRLEYVSAMAQARQMAINKRQAENDLTIALLNLNRWMGGDTRYRPDDRLDALDPLPRQGEPSLAPSLQLADEQVRLAEARWKMERAEALPKLFVEAGSQKIGSATGYFSYQVGVSFPLFGQAQRGRTRAAAIERDKAVEDRRAQQLAWTTGRKTLDETYRKWAASVDYYQTTALPVAREQQATAVLSYREGAADYMELVQNLREAARTELDYWDAYAECLAARFNYLYFTDKQ